MMTERERQRQRDQEARERVARENRERAERMAVIRQRNRLDARWSSGLDEYGRPIMSCCGAPADKVTGSQAFEQRHIVAQTPVCQQARECRNMAAREIYHRRKRRMDK